MPDALSEKPVRIIFDHVAGEVIKIDTPEAELRWQALMAAQVKPSV